MMLSGHAKLINELVSTGDNSLEGSQWHNGITMDELVLEYQR